MDAAAPLTLAPASPTRRRRPEWLAWAAFAPLAVWLAVLVVAPTLVLVAVSFCETDPDLGTPTRQFTLEHYREIFDPAVRPTLGRTATAAVITGVIGGIVLRRRWAVRWGLLLGGGVYLHRAVDHLPGDAGAYLRTFWRSVELAGGSTLLCLLVGYPVAFAIGRSRPPWRGRLLLAVLVPFWTSFLIRTYAWVTILSQGGLLNATLTTLHLSVLIPAGGAVLYTPAAVVLGLVYAYLPFMILPIYASVERLDATLIEASLDLGAGPLRTMARVVLPLTAPGVAAGVLLVFVPALGMYAVSTLLGGGRSPLLGDVINDQYGAANDQPLGAALGVVLIASFGLALLATGVKRPAR